MKTQKIKKSCSLKQVRRFSESIKKQVVKDIELGNCTVLAASRELMVSATSIYKWIYKYSLLNFRKLKKRQKINKKAA